MAAAFTPKEIFEHSLRKIEVVEGGIAKAGVDLTNMGSLPIMKSPSSIDFPDLGMAIIAGVIGGLISSSEGVDKFLNNIHDEASASNPKSFFGKVLHHQGDSIDQLPGTGKFLDREGLPAGVRFHRLFFGHDVFSASNDNPVYQLVKQHGVPRGALQVVRHLTADTCSKQGLPIPFSSFLDTHSAGKLNNWLAVWSDQVAQGSGLKSPQVFGHMFALRMQDILAQGLTWAICLSYIKIRGIKDEIRASEIKLIAYTTNFFTNCIVGAAKYGVPYISWPALAMVLKELYTFFKLNYADLKHLEKLTTEIVCENERLERTVFLTGSTLKTYSNGKDYIKELDSSYKSFNRLTNVFEEDF